MFSSEGFVSDVCIPQKSMFFIESSISLIISFSLDEACSLVATKYVFFFAQSHKIRCFLWNNILQIVAAIPLKMNILI